MSRKGSHHDNILMNVCCKILQRELVNDASFASIKQARCDIFKNTATYHHLKGLCSGLDDQTLLALKILVHYLICVLVFS